MPGVARQTSDGDEIARKDGDLRSDSGLCAVHATLGLCLGLRLGLCDRFGLSNGGLSNKQVNNRSHVAVTDITLTRSTTSTTGSGSATGSGSGSGIAAGSFDRSTKSAQGL